MTLESAIRHFNFILRPYEGDRWLALVRLPSGEEYEPPNNAGIGDTPEDALNGLIAVFEADLMKDVELQNACDSIDTYSLPLLHKKDDGLPN